MSEKTAEQQARDFLERLGVDDAQSWSAGELVELANLIADAGELVELANLIADANAYRHIQAITK